MEKTIMKNLLHCPVTATMEVIGGKWKLLIIYLISNDINRFGKMGMMLKNISKQMLTTQLRELENDGIIERKIYAEIPPRVEYFLTAKGNSLTPVIERLRDFGMEFLIPREEASVDQLHV
ncbi:winged helix-turn-helix transcriptional regulator [Pseudochryseolinea flava]|uniref:Transcriptional regulator n=1 Tax=Pseudochryseolinea flava TaxID=2059302 RepID=A0A364XXI3_9BACT|nr:helix-turn-helix domain-containing protein [Pseudochryseolinea flava]RAV98487.1 transcriptional regulator [Pseudochryseolinea flava]